MKYLSIIVAVCILASCSKEEVKTTPFDQSGVKPESCDFGLTNFNLEKREPLTEALSGKGKPPRFNWSNVNTGTTMPAPSVILLDFDGHTVANTPWNAVGELVCAGSNLSYEATGIVFERIANDFSPFNVIVTTDESVFNNTPINKRMRVIFTESWEWFGQAGGAAFTNTFGMTTDIPCFIFTSLLNYNTKAIAEAGAHEMGHTLGLQHQSAYNANVLVSQYNYGIGSGQTSWAPIMGCAYYRNISTWHNGATAYGYNQTQDEIAIITNKLGLNPDDFSGTTTGAQLLSGSKNGVIHSSGDVDCFYVNNHGSATISAIPVSADPDNSGANMDLQLKIYDKHGQLIQTVNDPSLLHASASLGAGEYFISVSVAGNANCSSYGMIGKYSITKN